MSLRSNTFRLLALTLGAALAACGGGGSSNASSTSNNSGTGTSTGLTGTFVDTPIQGLSFSASPSALTGTTDSTGAFKYKTGDAVTFSVNVGASVPSVMVGAVQPVAPANGNAMVFVLSLPNGLQVAQVLQSLDHSTSPVQNVAGLALSSAAVNAINAYTSSGGTVLPAGQTDLQMLAAAQVSNTAANTTFKNSGGVSVGTTLGNLNSTINNLVLMPSVNLSSLLPGKGVFHQVMTDKGNGTATYNPGFVYFNASGTAYKIEANQGPTVSSATYSATSPAGNLVTLTQNGIVDTLTMVYLDSSQGLWSGSTSNGSSGSEAWNFVDTAFGPGNVAGKTLTLTSILSGACGTMPIQLAVDPTGANYTTSCKGSATQIGSGTIAAVSSVPGILSFTDSSSGKVHYIGLLAGSGIANGTVAVVNADVTNPGGGLASVTAQ